MQDSELKALWTMVSEGLYYIWDPIGVSYSYIPRNEYDSYVGPVVRLLDTGASTEEIADHLDSIVAGPISLEPDRSRSTTAATFMVEAADKILERGQG